jgi:nucleotide-binding universal stress UspA family protein
MAPRAKGHTVYSRILVPLDGTTFSEQALELAVTIARRCEGTLHLAMVDLTPVGFPDVEELPPMSTLESGYLEGLERRVQEAGVAKVSSALLVGEIVETLEEHRLKVGADLTVMSTHGRGPIQRAWLGNVADRFTRTTTAPVILLRPVEDEDDQIDLTSGRSLGRIMVTLDGSELSESALGPATTLGRPFDAEYLLTRVIHPSQAFPSVYLPHVASDNAKVLAEAKESAQKEMDAVRGRLEAEGLTSHSHVPVVTHVAQSLIDITHEKDIDLLVMATHGHGGIARLLLGSVTDKVLRGGDVPLMIVPATLAEAAQR